MKLLNVVSLALASATALAQSTVNTTSSAMFQLSTDQYFAFVLEEILALSNNDGAATGEVLRIASQIKPGDFESFYGAFYYMAEQIYAIAESVNTTRDPVSAREAFFRAASYYRAADFFLHGNLSDPRIYSLWNQALNSFDHAIALLDIPAERVTLKAHGSIGNFEVPAIFYKAAPCNTKRPTVIAFSGYDGSQEALYHSMGQDILARGYNFLTLEGPGQATVRRQQNLGFIPDWNSAVTPVVDYAFTRPDVDTNRLALYGFSFGGTLAPRAAAYEKRVSAVVAIEGLVSLLASIQAQFPAQLTELYETNRTTAFDEYITAVAANTTLPTSFRWVIDQGLFAFNTRSATQWWNQAARIVMDEDIVSKLIGLPVFVGKAENDFQTGDQPDQAYQLLTTGRPNGKALTTFHEFKTALGAGEHCSLGAEAQQSQVVLNWLADVFEAKTGKEETLNPYGLCGGGCFPANSTISTISDNTTAFNASLKPTSSGGAQASAYTGPAALSASVYTSASVGMAAAVSAGLLLQ